MDSEDCDDESSEVSGITKRTLEDSSQQSGESSGLTAEPAANRLDQSDEFSEPEVEGKVSVFSLVHHQILLITATNLVSRSQIDLHPIQPFRASASV